MFGNLNIIYPQDAKRIDIYDPYEMQKWCKSLGCTEQELRAAVKAVGTSGALVRKYLANS